MSDVQIAKPNRLKAFPFGEAALWLGFLWFAASAMDSYRSSEDAVMMAAVFALAAIGVRATRPVRNLTNG